MARFKGTIKGRNGEASRLGNEKEGIEARINGWELGVKVYGFVDSKTGKDVFHIYKTGGSNGGQSDEHVLTVCE